MLHRSTGCSNHLHPDRRRGRVDVVYVRGETARRVFAELRTLPGPGGRAIKAPKPEHLIAMKVDIAHLLGLEGVDRTEVRGYFEKNGLLARWEEIEALVPPGALERRPPTPAGRPPFTLE